MTGVSILGTGRYLPKKIIGNEDFTKIVETSDEWIATRTGMKHRHIAAPDEPTWYMGACAAKSALEAAELSAQQIDIILVTTVTPDYYTPSTACIIQGELGAVNAFAFDINVACAGFAYALDLARRYLQDDDIRHILIVSCETLSQITNYNDRSTCILFGDGAGACVVGKAQKRFASFLHSDPAGAQHILAKHTRRNIPFIAPEDAASREPFAAEYDESIIMNGNNVYKFATKAMPEAVEKACAKIGAAPCDLSLLIPHQANSRIIETARKSLRLPKESVYVNIHEYGNTSSASIVIALDECVRGGRLKRGDLLCLVGFGAGLVYGACALEY